MAAAGVAAPVHVQESRFLQAGEAALHVGGVRRLIGEQLRERLPRLVFAVELGEALAHAVCVDRRGGRVL